MERDPREQLWTAATTHGERQRAMYRDRFGMSAEHADAHGLLDALLYIVEHRNGQLAHVLGEARDYVSAAPPGEQTRDLLLRIDMLRRREGP